MTYCTTQDMIERIGQAELIDLTNPGGDSINLEVLANAMLDAAALIESYLGSRYNLPLNPIPKVLVRVACNITRFYLYTTAVPDQVEKLYQDDKRFLADIAKGHIRLGISDTGEQATQNESAASINSNKTVWSRDHSSGFI